MLDASQARVVAYITEHGEIIHESHLPDEVIEAAEAAAIEAKAPTGTGWRVFDQAIEDAGYSALIRYSIHEMESQNAYDIERYPDNDELAALLDEQDELLNLRDDEDLTDEEDDRLNELVDLIEELIDDLAAVLCSECGERIE